MDGIKEGGVTGAGAGFTVAAARLFLSGTSTAVKDIERISATERAPSANSSSQVSRISAAANAFRLSVRESVFETPWMNKGS